MEIASGLSGLIMIFVTVAGIMAIFIPFWVYRIRNEIIETNRLLRTLVSQQTGITPETHVAGNAAKPIKKCLKCGMNNKAEDLVCMYCQGPLK